MKTILPNIRIAYIQSIRCVLILSFLCFYLVVECQKQLEKLPSSINTREYDEVSPVLNPKNNVLYFTRVGDPNFIDIIEGNYEKERGGIRSRLKNILSQISGKTIDNPEQSSFNQDIFLSNIVDNRFRKPIHPGYPLNNAFPNSVCATFPG